MNDTEKELRHRLLNLVAVVAQYCSALQEAPQMERKEFLEIMTNCLPRIYWEFSDMYVSPEDMMASESDDVDAPGEYDLLMLQPEMPLPDYVDEDYYESVRRGLESLFGEDDTYLETFEEDMKYSDTPIPASVSEGLADLFQPLYNFLMTVKESDGEQLVPAFRACSESFAEYWSQTLCNVLRPINNLRFK